MLIMICAAAALYTHAEGWYLASAAFDVAMIIETVVNIVTLTKVGPDKWGR